MIRKLFLAAMAALATAQAACMHTTAGWVRVDGAPGDITKDSYECERDTRQSHFPVGIIGMVGMSGFFDRCMLAHGWTKSGGGGGGAKFESSCGKGTICDRHGQVIGFTDELPPPPAK